MNFNIVRLAMRRPIATVVVVLAVILTSVVAIVEMKRDILPSLGIPIIYVAQPFGGMDPAQMESYLTYFYEYHFLYESGIEHIESKNIQSAALIKLQFYPGTDMAQAMAETINYVNRSLAFMPDGVVPPFVMRFDAGTVPVGKLIFSSTNKARTMVELQNYALNYVRPLFATLEGVSAPPPFGASARSIVINVDPDKLASYSLSTDDVAKALMASNRIVPSGNIKMGDMYPIVPFNGVVKNIKELEDVPLRMGTFPTVFLRDVGHVVDGSDIPTSYALVNGQRTVYIPVTKRPEASTLAVVDRVKANIPKFQAAVPQDVKVSYEFDQSGSVRRSMKAVLFEGALGALLTALMVILFLRDWRIALVVVVNIPIALLAATTALWLSGQTVNLMTLGGLALAVGILVDEAVVTIENIHQHLSKGERLAVATLKGTNEILLPGLLTMLCILSVFTPSLFMTGVARALFVPLSLAVGFSIVASFLLSRTLVPVLSTWLLKEHDQATHLKHKMFDAFQSAYAFFLKKALVVRWVIIPVYVLACCAIIILVGTHLPTEIFPRVDEGEFKFRLRAPTGSYIDHTEAVTIRAMNIIKNEVGEHNVADWLAFIGVPAPTYPVNLIHQWSSGPQEAVVEVALKKNARIPVAGLKEKLRARFAKELDHVTVSFEPSGIVDQTMSLGSNTPIEIAINGQDLSAVRAHAEKIRAAIHDIPSLRDVSFGQPFDYPAIAVNASREKAGLRGVSMHDIGMALVPATSSSRFILKNYWADPKNGINYQVQVEVPPGGIHSVKGLEDLTVSVGGGAVPLHDFAEVKQGVVPAEFDRLNMQRMVTVQANLAGNDLGAASREIAQRIKPLEKEVPRGLSVHVRGQTAALKEIFSGLFIGLAVAVLVIFLLLAANFESITLSLVVLSTVPAVLSGVELALYVTRTSLNIQSFMGAIMAVGVAVANAILLVTFAERDRIQMGNSHKAAIEGARSRIRPILMTALAMIAGMIPMAIGISEGGQQTAPLGRAVIGGLLASTIATLMVLPLVYAVALKRKSTKSPSLDPGDEASAHYQAGVVS